MSPLHVEVFNPSNKDWARVGEVHPTDPKGSMSDNKPNGHRDVYLFGCAEDDSKSTIYRSKFGADAEIMGGRFREIATNTSNLEVVKELKDGESFEIDVKTDRSPEKSTIRFTHKRDV